MSKWLCKLSVLSSYPFIFTYFEQASSTDASVFGEHVTKGLKQEGARACTLGEQPFSISGLGVNSWTMGLWLCIHCPLVFRMLTVSLPRDHLASALTNSITLISCSLWFTGPRYVSPRLVQSISTSHSQLRISETKHPFKYLRIALSFQKAVLYNYISQG